MGGQYLPECQGQCLETAETGHASRKWLGNLKCYRHLFTFYLTLCFLSFVLTQIVDSAGESGCIAQVHLDKSLVLPKLRLLPLILRSLVVTVSILVRVNTVIIVTIPVTISILAVVISVILILVILIAVTVNIICT